MSSEPRAGKETSALRIPPAAGRPEGAEVAAPWGARRGTPPPKPLGNGPRPSGHAAARGGLARGCRPSPPAARRRRRPGPPRFPRRRVAGAAPAPTAHHCAALGEPGRSRVPAGGRRDRGKLLSPATPTAPRGALESARQAEPDPGAAGVPETSAGYRWEPAGGAES
ncbi:hypothetical protein VULLAG_LOCUS4651 [Vulpes lagopus]